jgi:hypothetical protein
MSLFSTKEESILLNGVGSNNTNNNTGDSTTDITSHINNNNHNKDDLLLVNDDETWQVYEGIMRQVMTANRVLKKDKLESMKPVHDFILSNHPARLGMPAAPTIGSSTQELQEASTVVDDDAMVVKDNGTGNNNSNNSSTTTSSATTPSTTTTTMRAQLNLQQRTFMETYQWTQAQYDYAVRCFTYMGDFCAKNQTTTTQGGGGGNPIVVAWHKLKECGMIPKENCISTYMYVLSLEDEDKHDNNDDNNYYYNSHSASSVLMEVATFHDLLFPPNEKTVTLRIKSLIAQGNVQEAEAILQSLPVSVYV